MSINFKTKISLWYAGIFSIILVFTFFISFKIVSYKLKVDILKDIKSKTSILKKLIHKNTLDKNTTLNKIKLYTEIADNNYSIFIFLNNKLFYKTPRQQHLFSHLFRYKIRANKIEEYNIEGLPIYVSYFKHNKQKIYITYKLNSVKSLQKNLLYIFLAIFPFSILISILGGFVLTQKSMNIIKKIDITAQNITSNNLNKRIPLSKGNDEITDLIKTLNSMIDRLEKSFLQAKQFSQDAAHEIKTPLTIIKGEIENLIELEIKNNKTTTVLENILEEVQYLSNISNRLLLIHNIDTHNIKYNFEELNFTELMNEIIEDIKILSIDKNIEIKYNIEENMKIRGNKELLSRLLWNIADNAIKYNNVNGWVKIIAKKENNSICIKIIDNGIGIPKSEALKIFDRFYRVDKSRSRQLGGSGLGLSICKWIVELHNGKLSVESKEYVGSKFTITLSLLNS